MATDQYVHETIRIMKSLEVFLILRDALYTMVTIYNLITPLTPHVNMYTKYVCITAIFATAIIVMQQLHTDNVSSTLIAMHVILNHLNQISKFLFSTIRQNPVKTLT